MTHGRQWDRVDPRRVGVVEGVGHRSSFIAPTVASQPRYDREVSPTAGQSQTTSFPFWAEAITVGVWMWPRERPNEGAAI